MLSRLAADSDAVLVLSVPNVTHKDIALKLLLGRWDITEAGLLDHTHVSLYSKQRLEESMTRQGWREVGANDWLLEQSDQHFPHDLPLLNVRTPVGHFARLLLDRANPYSLVNQFVRAYRLTSPRQMKVPPPTDLGTFFLSVFLVLDPSNLALATELVKELNSQSDQDFELIIIPSRKIDTDQASSLLNWIETSTALAARTKIVRPDASSVAASLNAEIGDAVGKYISVLRSSDRITADWITTFRELNGRSSGALLRARREQSVQSPLYEALLPEVPTALSELIVGRPHSIAEVAIPRKAISSFGISFDPELEEIAKFHLVSMIAIFCGIAISNTVTVRQFDGVTESVVSEDDRLNLLSRLNGHPILFPSGAAERILRLIREKSWFETQHEKLVSELRDVCASNEVLQKNALEAAAIGREVETHLVARNQNDELKLKVEELSGDLKIEQNRFKEALDRIRILEDQISNNKQPVIEFLEDSPQLTTLINHHRPGLLSRFRDVVNTDEKATPFLSIITRTQGLREQTLRDVFMTLAGQSCSAFELILVVHSQHNTRAKAMRQLVEEFPQSFQDRVVFLHCTRPGRSAPINDALEVARGEYFSVLDDDDFVFGHWVETFRNLAHESPGSLLRTVCTLQKHEMVAANDGVPRPRATSWFKMEWPAVYDPLRHLYENLSPFMTIAFPLGAFRRLGFRFDETLTTAEDWDLTTRMVMLCGVRTSLEVTAIYRWWTNAESSLFVHEPKQWVANRQYVLDKLNARPIVLPPGAVRALVAIYEEQNNLKASLTDASDIRDNLLRELKNAGIYQAGLEDKIENAKIHQAELQRKFENTVRQKARLEFEIEGAAMRQAALQRGIAAGKTQVQASKKGLARMRASIKASSIEAASLRSDLNKRRFSFGLVSKNSERLIRLMIEVLESSMFDRDWYLDRYEDVRTGGIDPLRHFVIYGMEERRDPGPDFDTSYYLQLYADIAASGMSPFLHYLRYGRSEGRQCSYSD